MSEDRLLHDLGHLAREEQEAENARLDERWDRLSAGTLTPEEEAELRALAATSPEAAEAYEAFRPLGPEFQARVVQKIRDQARRAKPLPWRQRAVRWGGWSVAAASAAAASLVILLRPPLPGYTPTVITGGSRTLRGEVTEAMDFAPGDRFQMILRPDTEVAWTKFLKVQVFLRLDRELRRLDAESHVEPNGMVKLEGSLDRDLRPGVWTLWAVVGRRGRLPDPEELRSFSAQAPIRRRDWVAVPRNVRIRPRAP